MREARVLFPDPAGPSMARIRPLGRVWRWSVIFDQEPLSVSPLSGRLRGGRGSPALFGGKGFAPKFFFPIKGLLPNGFFAPNGLLRSPNDFPKDLRSPNGFRSPKGLRS